MSDRIRLKRAHSCIRGLTYDVEHHEGRAVGWILERLGCLGWARRSRLPGLTVYSTTEGHDVQVVEATGRVQIKVSYTVPLAERPLAAHEVFLAMFSDRATGSTRVAD